MHGSILSAKAIFSEAMDRASEEERSRYLSEACGANVVVREEVESLIRAFEGAGSFLENPVPPGLEFLDFGIVEGPGSVIDGYTLLEPLGEGGMGVVYRAEESRPVRRIVALKIIKPGMDTRQVIARFTAERQALAMMDHPNIAKVLGGGWTESGRPYFAMELVPGLPVTRFCEEHRLATRERLRLFVSACEAMRHAHQKGVIHRDLKPTNILVSIDDVGRPALKIIDFGIAKALDQPLTEATLTREGAVLGTLDYMSPEQAENRVRDVDTQSDVYSLGVILYELLTGTTPLLNLTHHTLHASVRRIADELPPRPSDRIEALALALGEPTSARLRSESRKRAGILRGELDWIVLRALEKERDRRYPSANDLARDIERYLNNETVEARPQNAGYRFKRFVRRHWKPLATLTAFVVVLLAAMIAIVRESINARISESRALQSEAETATILDFFRGKVLAAARPVGKANGLGKDVTVRAAIDAAERAIPAEFPDQPRTEAAIRDTLGTTYFHQDEMGPAIVQFERALALRRAVLGNRHADTLMSMSNLASAYRQARRPKDAIALFEEALAILIAEQGRNQPDTMRCLSNLASTYKLDGRLQEAIRLFEEVLAFRESTLKPDDPELLIALNNLAAAYQAAGRIDRAIPLHERDLAASERRLGRTHPDTVTSMNNLATAYIKVGRAAEAVPFLAEVVKIRRGTLGTLHAHTQVAMTNLAAAYQRTGKTDEALPLLKEVATIRRDKLGDRDPLTIRSINSLAIAYLRAARPNLAVPEFERLLDALGKSSGAASREALAAWNHLIDAYVANQDWTHAESSARACLESHLSSDPDDWLTAYTQCQLGIALAAQNQADAAAPLLAQGTDALLARRSRVPASWSLDVSAMAARAIAFHESRNDLPRAEAWRSQLAMVSGQASGK